MFNTSQSEGESFETNRDIPKKNREEAGHVGSDHTSAYEDNREF